MIDFLFNILDEVAEVEELENGVAVVTLENGEKREFKNYDAAINKLYKWGFRF